MIITLDDLKKMYACDEGLVWFKCKYNKVTDIHTLSTDLLIENKENWLNWFIVKKLSMDLKVKYAIYSAVQALPILENKYPDDKRPRVAIDVAKKYLENKDTKTAADAACAAAAAAYAAAAYSAYAAAAAAAAYSAYAAADTAAAYDDVSNGSDPSAYAADAAYYAADAAAVTAAAAAADAAKDSRKEMYKKILDYGVELLLQENKK